MIYIWQWYKLIFFYSYYLILLEGRKKGSNYKKKIIRLILPMSKVVVKFEKLKFQLFVF